MENSRLKLPPLEWIRAFEAAARCGSFTAAAGETGLTQSAISQRIGHLEKLLGAKLFERRPRAIALTVEGEAWLPHVRSALSSLQDSSEALFGARRGRVTISASLSVIDLWLAPRLQRLTEKTAAQISLQTMVLGAHSVPQDEVIRIRYGSGDWPHFYTHRLYSEKITPVVAPEFTRREDPWTSWPRITVSGPRPSWNDWADQFGIPTTPLPVLRLDTYAPAQTIARAGGGVLLASLALCEADLKAGNLVRVSDDVLAHHESYWMLASKEAVTKPQWDDLVSALK
ncbi:LysR family transcriptional regulator [Falsihalocynthiibacter sp. S25ZX9]|uniref:LysR family transcriptional regulator n=1 Tax=Falsihalocynthiibacter sp. S25ZX9 TaxID=3240870 RepID=UPI00350E8EAA